MEVAPVALAVGVNKSPVSWATVNVSPAVTVAPFASVTVPSVGNVVMVTLSWVDV